MLNTRNFYFLFCAESALYSSVTQLEVKSSSAIDSILPLHRSSHVLLEVPLKLVSESEPQSSSSSPSSPTPSPADYEPESSCALLLIGGLESERRACDELFVLHLAVPRATASASNSGTADAPLTPELDVRTLALDGTLRAR